MKQKHLAKILAGLLLVALLAMAYLHRLGASSDSAAVTTSARLDQAVPEATPRARDPDVLETDSVSPPEPANQETPAFEDSWAIELRSLKELAAVDPDAALARVAQMPDKHERKASATAICPIVSKQDPAKAMTAAWQLGVGGFADDSAENAALESLAQEWASANPAEAFAWASALPADDEWRRDRVVKGIALAVAKISPADAAALVSNEINPDSSVQIDAAIAVLTEWATREYEGAVAWASLFPEGPIRERGLEELGASRAPAASSTAAQGSLRRDP